MTDHNQIFLSYSRNDLEAAASLRGQLEQARARRLQGRRRASARAICGSRACRRPWTAAARFVVLVGRDGVRRWIGAETQVALTATSVPTTMPSACRSSPILLGDDGRRVAPGLPAAVPGHALERQRPLPERLLEQIRDRAIVASDGLIFEGCPFVGLDAFRIDQAQPLLRPPEGDPGRARLLRHPRRAARPCAGWRSTATAARASPR